MSFERFPPGSASSCPARLVFGYPPLNPRDPLAKARIPERSTSSEIVVRSPTRPVAHRGRHESISPGLPASVTVAHDYLTQRGGAERVATTLVDAWGLGRIVTAVHSPRTTFAFDRRTRVETTMLQHFSAFRRDPRLALVILPFAWRSLPPVSEGIVVCSSSGWSHLLRVRPGVLKVVYCHNPPRWLYQWDDYAMDQPVLKRLGLAIARPLLKYFDKKAAREADLYIANSTSVARRIGEVYQRTAEIVHPPVSISAAGEQRKVETGFEDFFLAVGRVRGYKNIRLLAEAFSGMDSENLVIVGSASIEPVPANVRIVTNVSDAELRWLYSKARALVSVAHEDFGLTPLEANVFGTPALVLRAGGFLDSVHEGVSGRYIAEATPQSIVDAVHAFPRSWDCEAIRAHADTFSTSTFLARLERIIRDHMAGADQRVTNVPVPAALQREAPLPVTASANHG